MHCFVADMYMLENVYLHLQTEYVQNMYRNKYNTYWAGWSSSMKGLYFVRIDISACTNLQIHAYTCEIQTLFDKRVSSPAS